MATTYSRGRCFPAPTITVCGSVRLRYGDMIKLTCQCGYVRTRPDDLRYYQSVRQWMCPNCKTWNDGGIPKPPISGPVHEADDGIYLHPFFHPGSVTRSNFVPYFYEDDDTGEKIEGVYHDEYLDESPETPHRTSNYGKPGHWQTWIDQDHEPERSFHRFLLTKIKERGHGTVTDSTIEDFIG